MTDTPNTTGGGGGGCPPPRCGGCRMPGCECRETENQRLVIMVAILLVAWALVALAALTGVAA